MASQWHYRLGDQELGPIAYDELIQLVREGMVREEDLVRREWPADWQRADSVVGLFHMARRKQEEEAEETEERRAAAEEMAEPETASSAKGGVSPSRWRWLAWLLSGLFRPKPAPVSSAPAIASDRNVAEVPAEAAPLATARASQATAKPAARLAEPMRTDHPVNQAEQNGLAEPRPSEPSENVRPGIIEGTGHPVETNPPIETVPPQGGNEHGGNEWDRTVTEALNAADARDAALARDREKEEGRGRSRAAVQAILAWPVYLVTRPILFVLGWLIGSGRARTRDRVAAGLSALERWLPHPSILRIGFKLGAGIGAANLAAFGILRWSARQALRFPSAEPEAGRAFPLIGECGPAEFGFFVFQAALLAGVAAYGVAAVLEANTDD